MAPGASVQRVLVVDDEPDITSAVAVYLVKGLGVEVEQAGSADEALQRMAAADVDLIITDYKMPGTDGLQLLKEVARRWPDVPRVLMTAYPDVELAILALNEGRILHFVSKPILPDDLRDVVHAILEERRARHQREAALQRSLETMRRRAQPGKR